VFEAGEGVHSRVFTMKLPLSVYYITLNEEDRLPESLGKVKGWVSEIIVVDSGSTDRTRELAAAAGARVVRRDWEGFASQKAYAASLCANDWVLDLDADEVLSDELVQNIKALFSGSLPADVAGYRMRWVLSPPDAGHPYRYERQKWILRLYNRKRASIQAEADSHDDRPKVLSGRVRNLPGDVLHRTLVSLEQTERKYCQLSSEQARLIARKGRNISNARLALEFPLKFLKYYVLRGQFRNGWFGFCLSVASANRNFMRLAKARELQMLKERSEG